MVNAGAVAVEFTRDCGNVYPPSRPEGSATIERSLVACRIAQQENHMARVGREQKSLSHHASRRDFGLQQLTPGSMPSTDYIRIYSYTRTRPAKVLIVAHKIRVLKVLTFQWPGRTISVVSHHASCIVRPQAYLWEVYRENKALTCANSVMKYITTAVKRGPVKAKGVLAKVLARCSA